jgi:hypothetical protein
LTEETTEAGKRDLNLSSEKTISRTTRSSLFILASIAVFSSVVVLQNLALSDLLDIAEEEIETKPTVPGKERGPTREAFRHVELTREERRGSWIGNNGVPPAGWKYYSASELRNFYRDTSILWIGDSTARRAATTMYGILNATNATNSSSSHVSVDEIDHRSVINVNKRSITEPCNRWMNHTHHPSLCRVMPGGSGRGGSFVLTA